MQDALFHETTKAAPTPSQPPFLPPSPIVPPGIKPAGAQPPDDTKPGYTWGYGKYGFNPQPDPPKSLHGYTWGYGIHGFNPQPDPPKGYVSGPRSDPDFPEADEAVAIGHSVGFAVAFVPLDDIEDLDAKIRQLDSEWLFQFEKIDPLSAAHKAWVAWRFDFVPWRAVWSGWKVTHVSLLQRSGDLAITDFQDFEAQYNELRRRFVEDLKATTGTKKQKTGSADKPGLGVEAANILAGAIALGAGAYFLAQLVKAKK